MGDITLRLYLSLFQVLYMSFFSFSFSFFHFPFFNKKASSLICFCLCNSYHMFNTLPSKKKKKKKKKKEREKRKVCASRSVSNQFGHIAIYKLHLVGIDLFSGASGIFPYIIIIFWQLFGFPLVLWDTGCLYMYIYIYIYILIGSAYYI